MRGTRVRFLSASDEHVAAVWSAVASVVDGAAAIRGDHSAAGPGAHGRRRASGEGAVVVPTD